MGVFPRPRVFRHREGTFELRDGCRLLARTEAVDIRHLLLRFKEDASERFGINVEIGDSGNVYEKGPYIVFERLSRGSASGSWPASIGAEHYSIDVRPGYIQIKADTTRGWFYGMVTLFQLAIAHDGKVEIPGVFIEDWPYKPIRGVHIYMPGREHLPYFYRLLDFLGRYKYNTVFIEVGAGMRFDRHPEINEAWKEFAREANSFPGGQDGLQASQGYWKNSVHAELGDGGFLEKSEVRELLERARENCLDVIPEIQSLGHAYWMLQAHKELAERQEDPYPDTYCPSNPLTYELLFDLMDEVIEVFEPKIVHIGHDEVYSLGLCPRCKGKAGAELFAMDVKKIHDYLASRGIKTAMWGEKLMNFVGGNGVLYGGVKRVVRDEVHGNEWIMPETYPAIDMLPKDILILDWYWSLTPETQDYFEAYGFQEIFGNFYGPEFRGWEWRGARANVLGAELSTWCAADEFTLGRDGKIFSLLYSTNMLWRDDVKDTDWEDISREIIQLMPGIRNQLSGQVKRPSHLPIEDKNGVGLGGEPSLPLPWGETSGLSCQAVIEGGARYVIPVMAHLESLVLIHTCDAVIPFVPSYSKPDLSDNVIGEVLVTYEDGAYEKIGLVYGINIGAWNLSWKREPDEKLPNYRIPDWLESLAYFTTPEKLEVGSEKGGAREVTVYAYEWWNPRPDVQIREICYSALPGGTVKIALLRAIGRLR